MAHAPRGAVRAQPPCQPLAALGCAWLAGQGKEEEEVSLLSEVREARISPVLL